LITNFDIYIFDFVNDHQSQSNVLKSINQINLHKIWQKINCHNWIK
jgi:hypothetical protein